MELRKIIDAILSRTKMMGNQDILKKFMSVEDISHLEDFFLLKNKLFDDDDDVKDAYVLVFCKLIEKINLHNFDTQFLKDNLSDKKNKDYVDIKDSIDTKDYRNAIKVLKTNKNLFIYLTNIDVLKPILSLYRIENKLFLDENMSVKCKYDESNNNFEIEGILKEIQLNIKENFKSQIKQCCGRFNNVSKDISNCHIHVLRNNLIIAKRKCFEKLRLFLIMEILGA